MKNTKGEWLSLINFKRSKRLTPKDQIIYNVSHKVVSSTIEVLNEYGSISHEGLVYWAGYQDKHNVKITTVIAPETESAESRVTVPSKSNFYVVKTLSKNRILHIGQVHSHPGSWVDHSYGDDEWASFKRHGLLSLVVPRYCMEGMLPFHKCGIHRFVEDKFLRLSDRYIKQHFRIVEENALFIDLRDKQNYRWKHQSGTN